MKKAIQLQPVVLSFIADTDTPVSIYLKLKKYFRLPFLFESVESGNRIGRFSFIGINPIFELTADENNAHIKSLTSWFEYNLTHSSQPIEALKEVVELFDSERLPQMPSFTSGLVGYFAYESIGLAEKKLQFNHVSDYECHLIHLLCFDTLIVFDNASRRVSLIGNIWKSKLFTVPVEMLSEESVRENLTKIRDMIIDLRPHYPTKHLPSEAKFNHPAEVHKESVKKIKQYISDGDIFQLVFSQRLTSTYSGDTFELYRALRVINPSPYLFYLDMNDGLSIIGSSPEVMTRVRKGMVEVRPIAGTRRRGLTSEEDVLIEKELRSDEKELAEHVMLIDLGRNDIGRVSDIGSVDVYDKMVIERYSHVMHIVSGVRGKLKENLTPVDAFFSCFPAGTLTGAPKIRSMEIIEELETVKRGIYGGAIGYIDFNGGMDTCIAIRTMVCKNEKLYLQAGSGIVADSNPEREYEEIIEKLNANLTSLSIVKDLLP